MTSTTWAVLGATGFVGSATVARLQADGQTVVPVSAPRLGSGARTVHHLLQQAGRLESVIDYLAESFAGAHVVVNAAGLAAPDQTHEESLVGANALITEGKRFEEGGLIVGAPARLVRPLSDTEKAALRLSAAHYAEKAAHYATDLELHR